MTIQSITKLQNSLYSWAQAQDTSLPPNNYGKYNHVSEVQEERRFQNITKVKGRMDLSFQTDCCQLKSLS